MGGMVSVASCSVVVRERAWATMGRVEDGKGGHWR